MGKPGAKKMDQIVSATPGDVHIIMIPSPGGPIPTPIPHPCASMIKDKVATKVKVMGQPGAVKGSKSKHTPPHIPMGPGPFQKPPKNEGEIITGSANVFYEGKEAAMLGDTGQMCSDPSDTPVGKVMGTAATVLVGGGGGGSDEAREQASADAMKAAAAAAHKWISKNMPPGADREKAHRDVCTATGHPVDVATGKLFTKNIDLKLPGRIPFEFTRNYSSARSDVGVFGRSWRHSYEAQLIVHRDFVAHRDHNGRFLEFEPIAVGGSVWNKLGRLTLRRLAEGYFVVHLDGLTHYFPWVGSAPEEAVKVPLRHISDRYNNRITLEYAELRLIRIVDSAGRLSLLEYNERGFVSALRLMPDPVVGIPQTIRTYAYSAEDDLIEVRDASGHSLRFAYANHLLVQEMDRAGFSFYFNYDQDGWCQETWGDGGILYRQMHYDRQKGMTRVTDSLGCSKTYEWTNLGVVTRETDHWGHSRVTKYNDSLQAIRVVDALGNASAYEYDDQGRLTAAEDPEGNSASFKWDLQGRLVLYTDLAGQKWQRSDGDSGGEVLTDPLGRVTTEFRDQRGNVTRICHPDGTETLCTYNASGDLTGVITPNGLRISRQHSATGDLLLKADQFGTRLEIVNDAMRRPERVLRRGRGGIWLQYDPEDRVLRVTEAKGRATEYEYTHFNKLKSIGQPAVTLADGRIVRRSKRFSYDTECRLTEIELAGGGKVVFHYEGYSRPMRVEYPDGRVQTYDRDARGFITKLFENGSLVYEQDSDSAGRVTRRLSGDGVELIYEYDAMGNLQSASGPDAQSLVEIERDEVGRVLSECGAFGAVQFSHEDARQEVSYNWEDQLQLVFRSNVSQAGKTLEAVRNGTADMRLEYDSENRLRCAEFASGDRYELDYGSGPRPTQRREVDADGATRTEDFSYDANGWLESVEVKGGIKQQYERDDLDRLTAVVVQDNGKPRRQCWGYDSSENRILATDAQGEQYRQVFLPGHRPHQVGGDYFEYDQRGRVTSLTNAKQQTTRYVWDAGGRLKQVQLPNGESVEMRYDALGRRIEKVSSRGTTRFGWFGNRMVHEELPTGETRHYVYHTESFSPLACYLSGSDGVYRLHPFFNDLRGAPVRMNNHQGKVVWEKDVGPWGESSETGSTGFAQPIAMPGQYRDEETGLHYNYARYYLPQAGAYLSPDPAGLAGGDNPYAYVADPICWSDPLGLSADDGCGTETVSIYHGTLDENALRATGFTTVNSRGDPVQPPFVCISTDQSAADDAAFTTKRPTGDAPAVLEGKMSQEEWDRLHRETDSSGTKHLTTNPYTGWGTVGSTETKARTPEGVAALNKAFGLPGGG